MRKYPGNFNNIGMGSDNGDGEIFVVLGILLAMVAPFALLGLIALVSK